MAYQCWSSLSWTLFCSCFLLHSSLDLCAAVIVSWSSSSFFSFPLIFWGGGSDFSSVISGKFGPRFSSVQFSSVQPLSRVWLFATPWTAACQASLSITKSILEFTHTHVRWVGDAIQPSHPLSSPSPPALNLSQQQGLFKWVRSSHKVAQVLEFQRQHFTLRLFENVVKKNFERHNHCGLTNASLLFFSIN